MLRKTLKNRLDREVKRIVLERDKNCITCDCRLDEFNATPGHFMKRRYHTTRWNLKNVNGQCVICNVDDDTELYRQAMILRYGKKLTRDLEILAHQQIRFTNSELSALLVKLKST